MNETIPPPAAPASSRKAWWVMALFCLALLVPYLVPGQERWRLVKPAAGKSALEAIVSLRPAVALIRWSAEFEQLVFPPVPVVQREYQLPPPPELVETQVHGHAAYRLVSRRLLERIAARLPAGGLEDPTGALDPFFRALARTKSGAAGAITRIVHFGDSPVTGDLISGGARFRFQEEFGDAGHGWIYPQAPWEWYRHFGVEMSGSGWRAQSPVLENGNGGRCGLGGVCFRGASGARSRIATEEKGFGSAVGRFDIYFEQRPQGGKLALSVDGEPREDLDTRGPGPQVKVHSVDVSDGRHVLNLAGRGDGEIVLFGVVLERGGAGVVYDSHGANGGTVHFLNRLDPENWTQSLAQRRPDLVILNYGTNESSYGNFSKVQHSRELKEVIGRIRAALPGVAILIMAPMDRGMRDAAGQMITMPAIPLIVEIQREVAQETGCAFFNTFEAMGGPGTMARWYEGEPRLVSGDLTHPNGTGADLVSKLLVDALKQGFSQWSGRAEQQPAPAHPASEGGE